MAKHYYGDAVAIVAGILASGDTQKNKGREDLYLALQKYIYPFFLEQLRDSADAQDELNDMWIIVLKAIENGKLREPENMFGYVKVIAKRRMANAINDRMRKRQVECQLDPSAVMPLRRDLGIRLNSQPVSVETEKQNLIARTMANLRPNEAEILRRFYIDEQGAEQIKAEMGLNKTQYRLLKSRAKKKFAIQAKVLIASPRSKLKLTLMLSGHSMDVEPEAQLELEELEIAA